MIGAVIDTNVFVSGIFWSGAPSRVLDAWQDGKFKLITSPDILNEYSRVAQILGKKHKNIDIMPIIKLVSLESEIHNPIKLPTPGIARPR